MKVLIITQHFPPDLGASAFRMKSLYDHLKHKDNCVYVLTATPNRYSNMNIKKSYLQSDNIVRVKVSPQKSSLIQRSWVYLIEVFEFVKKGIPLAKKADVILATTPPLTIAYVGAILSRISGKKLIIDIRDPWIDAAKEMGILKNKLLWSLLKKFEKSIYKKACTVVINSPAFVSYITSLNIKTRFFLITNGIEDEVFNKLLNIEEKLPKRPYIITYSGNLGKAQMLSSIIPAVKDFKDKIILRLIGDGTDVENIRKIKEELKIDNLEIHPPISRDKLFSKYFPKTDAFLVHLAKKKVFEKTIPSKIFEYMSTGKLILYGVDGVSKSILDEAKAGFWFEPENPKAFRKVIKEMINYFETGGKNKNSYTINYVKEHYLRSLLNEKWLKVLEEVSNAKYC